MQRKPKILNLVIKTQNAQEEFPLELINCFIPLNKKPDGTKTNLNSMFMPRKQEN